MIENINFLEETIEFLAINGKTPKDVLWVGLANGTKSISWKGFAKLADFEYNASYGSNYIHLGLVVVGDDWWLERGEYDGAEWWEFKTQPKKIINFGRLYAVTDHEFNDAHEISNPVRDHFEEWKETASEEELKELEKNEDIHKRK